MPKILLLGGAGRIGMHLTRLLLARGSSYHITSVIRNGNPAQPDHIRAAAKGKPGTCDIWVRSLEEVTKEKHAAEMIEESGAEWVLWCAGEAPK